MRFPESSATALASVARLIAGFLAAGILTVPASAHDFWIEPETYQADPGSIVPISLRVGEKFDGEPVPRTGWRIVRFASMGSDGENPVDGLENHDPAGHILLARGTNVVIYQSIGGIAEIDGTTFNGYIREEGLDGVIGMRRNHAGIVRDRFSRCAKALVVGGSPDAHFDDVAGLPLELVPESDPAMLAGGGMLRVRLLHESKPLAGALVVAMNRATPEQQIRLRTDSRGRVRLKLQSGEWLIKAVHAFEARDEAADWESLWASLTFVVPSRP